MSRSPYLVLVLIYLGFLISVTVVNIVAVVARLWLARPGR